MDKKVKLTGRFPDQLGSIHWQPPLEFNLAEAASAAKLDKLIKLGQVRAIYDHIQLAAEELFDIKHPDQKDSRDPQALQAFTKQLGDGNLDRYGSWFYFPWSGDLVHFPPRDDLRALRTSRNRNLVTAAEQRQLYGGSILIAGMSVGSNVVESLVAGGIGGKLILVDMDTLEPSNLNRIRASYHQVGMHKVEAIATKISQIDPYLEQVHYLHGLNTDNLEEIITTDKPDIIVDEMDDVRMKLQLRYRAKEHRLPVIMAADDGDNILLDIERYDQNPELPILHGQVPPAVIDQILGDKPLSRPELGMLIGKYFVGLENTPLRMFESLVEVGKTLPSWPQLGGAASLAGVILAYCSKKILLEQPLAAGRFLVGPDRQLNPEITTPQHQAKLKQFQQMFGGPPPESK